MRLGLLTACLPGESLAQIAAWAGGHGYAALEVAAWPRRPGREWEASHLDVASFGEPDATAIREMMARHALGISAIAYYENNLHHDPDVREATREHLRRCIDAAALLDVGLVGTFVGRDVTRTVSENLTLAEKVLPPLVEYAAARDVRLVVENCPMEGWHPDGYPANLAYSPELWDWLADLGLWLNYDPSHLVWLGIDPLAALEAHADRVLHVQAKDVEVDASARNRYGVFGRVVGREPWVSGWWRYRIPGLGEVDWRRLVDRLHQVGYDGVVSVEHEDPVWSGDPERVRRGLAVAERTLAPLVKV
jgi:sugar phosphate isomerase/epimerase